MAWYGNEGRYVDESVLDFYKRRYLEERDRAEQAEGERDVWQRRFREQEELRKRTEPPYA